MIIRDLEILKKKTLIAVIFVFIIISILKIYNSIKIYEQDKNRQKKILFSQTEYIYNSKIDIINRSFSSRLKSITSGKKIKQAIKDRDRKTLYNLSIKRFKTIQKDFPSLKIMHYHLPDNTSLLRINKPDKFGDLLKDQRLMIAKAIKDKTKQIGFESGIHYSKNIIHRVAVPIMEGDTLLAVVELGIDIEGIVGKIDKFFQASGMNEVYMAFLLKNKNFANKNKNINFNDYKISSNNPIVSSIIDKIDTSKEEQIVDIGDNSYFVFWGQDKLTDFNNNQLGTILYAFNITEVEGKFKRNLTLSALELLIGMAVLLMILIWLFNYIKKQSILHNTKMTNIVNSLREKDRQMIQQSRLAQMGEMISMIAHQWRQPLSAISATSASLKLKSQLGKLDKERTIELSDKILNYSQHLSSTIDDFREFFKSNKEKKEVNYTTLINSVFDIIKESIENKNITIITNLESKEILHTYPSEVKQVLLNLLKNAEDILIEKEIKDPQITIETREHILTISDNAGGIPKDILDKIFDPYFSTKTKKDGTGLGLYMSKTIIHEHCGGRLTASNNDVGAIFTIDLKDSVL